MVQIQRLQALLVEEFFVSKVHAWSDHQVPATHREAKPARGAPKVGATSRS